MNLEIVQIRIRTLMTSFVVQVKLATAQGDTFLNTLAETFLIPFLKEVYDLPNLKNLNQTDKKNFPAIDLGDKSKRVAIQVTSTATSDKVKKTLSLFTEHRLYDHFDHLLIYIISEKQTRYLGNKYDEITEGYFSFDKDRDIVDSQDVIRIISGFDIDKAKRVLEILERNFGNKSDTPIEKPPVVPPHLRALVADFEKQLAEHAHNNETIIGRMLEICQEFLDRQLINEAAVFLSKIDPLLLEVDNKLLIAKVDLLRAILLIRREQIPKAKQLLFQIIQTNPYDIEAVLEYVGLCENIPETDDSVESVEIRVRELANDHPKLQLIDLARQFQNQEVVTIPDISETWTDNIRLNTRFICQYALFCDLAQKTAQRDAFINRWENELPSSPRPHLFRVLFRIQDFYRSPSMPLQEQTRLAQDLLEYSASERKNAGAKDPLHLRDQISWLMQEIRLEVDFSDGMTDLGALRNRMASLIEQCYFGTFIDSTLPEFLGRLRLEPDQWRTLTRRIQESKVLPSQKLIEIAFLQAMEHKDLYTDLDNFINLYDRSNLGAILQAVKKDDAKAAAQEINDKKNPLFTLYMLESLANHDIAVDLAGLLEVDEGFQAELLYKRFQVLELHGREKEALDVIKKLSLDSAAPVVLHNVEKIAYRNQQWELFISSASQLLNFDISQSYRCHLHAGLASAFFDRGDDTNAIYHADQALGLATDLGDENSQTLLHLLARSSAMKGQYDEACKKFQKYEDIKRSFPLSVEEANLYLKASFADKYKKCLALIMRAFEEVDTPNDKHYLSAITLLIELSNVGQIPKEDEPSVEDRLFVKLDGFHNGWFYIGEEEEWLGAECIRPNTPNYDALIHKSIGDEIAWPADKYSKRNKRNILHIVTAPAYIAIRAHEAMMQAAETGNGGAWLVQVGREDGSIDIDVLNKFINDHFQSSQKFFDQYTSTRLPFAFLCRGEGSLAKALGKIVTEQKGFVYVNDSELSNIEAQKSVTDHILRGAACFIDGLSAYMLVEAGLLEAVIKAVPTIGVSTSVIRMLREIATDFEFAVSSVGWGTSVDGNFRFTPRNKQNEETFRTHLLLAADLLDSLRNKVIGKTYPKIEGEINPDSELPDYFVDTFRYAQEKEAYVLSDDALFVQTYKLLGVSPIPKQTSSFSLIRAMAENKQITWNDYFRYIARLLFYRYHFIPLSVDDMIQSVLPSAPSGLVTAAPQNIALLNLQLSLSQEYGVDEKVATSILASFYTKLILDNSVPREMADEIFALTIKHGLMKRDRRMAANVIYQICLQNVQNYRWRNQNNKVKLDVLGKHLFGFAQGIDPIVIDSALFLRTNIPRNKSSTERLD